MAAEDMQRAARLGAQDYRLKPIDSYQLAQIWSSANSRGV